MYTRLAIFYQVVPGTRRGGSVENGTWKEVNLKWHGMHETNERHESIDKLKWRIWNEWIETNKLSWMNWNERIEMNWNELKWRNWREWIDMNELKWRNWNASIETHELTWLKRDDMKEWTWLNWNEWIDMKEVTWRNWIAWLETHELTWMNWKEWISARLSSAAGREGLDTTWFCWSKNQKKKTFKIIKTIFVARKTI